MGRVRIAFAPANPFGVLDHDVTLPSGETVSNPVRVIANADGCDVVFTVRRRAGVSADEFAADMDAVTADLATLRELMEQGDADRRSAGSVASGVRPGRRLARRRRASPASPRRPTRRAAPPSRTPGPICAVRRSVRSSASSARSRSPIELNATDTTNVAIASPCQRLTADVGRRRCVAARRSWTNGHDEVAERDVPPAAGQAGADVRRARAPWRCGPCAATRSTTR